MSVIDNAIARIQDIALQCTGIHNAPDYPVEDATALPLVITHIVEGDGYAMNADVVQMDLVVNADFHFARVNIKDCYKKIDTLIPEFLQRLGGAEATLNSTIDTIQYPITFTVAPAQWDAVITQMVSFVIPFKVLTTPTTNTT